LKTGGEKNSEARQMTCIQCGSSRIRTETLPRYQDDGLVGLPNVVILNAAQQYTCEECGTENGVSVPDVEGLEAAAAVARIMIPVKLTGKEIRFLRTALGMKARELREQLEVGSEELVSRWEHEKAPISPRDEKMLRLLTGRLLSTRATAIGFDEKAIFSMKIAALSSAPRQKVEMTFIRIHISKNTWAEPAKAA
jgi:DNA-binding transcriptional regulator YiaG